MSRRQEDELFRQALSELDELDHEAMWRAKLGGEPVGGAGAGDDRPGTGQAPGRDEGAPPTGEDALFEQELLSTFAELLDGEEALAEPPSADDEPAARYRAVRVGESPVDLSPLPGLARPREAELRNLASGRREVDRRIDLHRRTVADGLRLLRDELAHARETGRHFLLVVTGRGLRSENGAHLRPAVQQFLAHEGREHVLWFDVAPPRLGGSGAYLVRLRRPGKERE